MRGVTRFRGGVNERSLFQYVHLKVVVSKAEGEAPWDSGPGSRLGNDPYTAETEVTGQSKTLLEENMRRAKRTGI